VSRISPRNFFGFDTLLRGLMTVPKEVRLVVVSREQLSVQSKAVDTQEVDLEQLSVIKLVHSVPSLNPQPPEADGLTTLLCVST
jgi:hypothetical protein